MMEEQSLGRKPEAPAETLTENILSTRIYKCSHCEGDLTVDVRELLRELVGALQADGSVVKEARSVKVTIAGLRGMLADRDPDQTVEFTGLAVDGKPLEL